MPGNPLQQRRSIVAGISRSVSLSSSGVLAALLIGAAALAAGVRWAVLLLVYFAAATAVSRFRGKAKATLTGGVVEKTGARDFSQVAANGLAFATGAAATAAAGHPAWAAFAAGALAASSADTWATELGLLARAAPRSIRNWRPVPPGTSGGVTLAGTVAGCGGALAVSAASVALGIPAPAAMVLAGGVAGMLIDSALGATIQERQWCPVCERPTERRLHSCGAATYRVGGVRGMSNDAVNALATIAGGGVAAALWLCRMNA